MLLLSPSSCMAAEERKANERRGDGRERRE
jgi:hypothetical protein